MGLEVSTIANISKALWQEVPPYIIAIGTFGNAMSIVVLLRKNIRRSNVAVYLIALSIVDTLVLWTGLFYHWIKYKYRYDYRKQSQFGCRLNRWATYFTLDLGVWILVALTIERLLSVCFPHKVKKLCTIKTSISAVIILAVVMAMLNIHIVFGFGDKTIVSKDGSTETIPCNPLTDNYEHFFNFVWSWIDLCVYSFVPLFIIAVSNVVIVYKVLVSSRSSRGSNVSSQKTKTQEKKRTSKVSSMTVLLIAINMTFMITTSPLSIYFVVYPTIDRSVMTIKGLWLLYLAFTSLSILQYCNNAMNFFFYCLSGSRFRNELLAIICRGKRIGPASRTSDAPENSTQWPEAAKTKASSEEAEKDQITATSEA